MAAREFDRDSAAPQSTLMRSVTTARTTLCRLLVLATTLAPGGLLRGAPLEPILQDIEPGYQSVTAVKYSYINRGDVIDIYDNRSRSLFRSVPAFMDQGAGKGNAVGFTVSRDERLLQARLWVKEIGYLPLTVEIVPPARKVQDVRVTGWDTGGSGEDFQVKPTKLPSLVTPRLIARFEEGPIPLPRPAVVCHHRATPSRGKQSGPEPT